MHEWVSVGEASRRLNVSPSTIRRMIEAGTLVGEREVIGGSKERYRVRVETQHDAPPSEAPDAPAASESTLALSEGLLALVREMRQQGVSDAARIEALIERAASAEARAEMLQAALDAERAAVERLTRQLARRRWWEWWRWGWRR